MGFFDFFKKREKKNKNVEELESSAPVQEEKAVVIEVEEPVQEKNTAPAQAKKPVVIQVEELVQEKNTAPIYVETPVVIQEKKITPIPDKKPVPVQKAKHAPIYVEMPVVIEKKSTPIQTETPVVIQEKKTAPIPDEKPAPIQKGKHAPIYVEKPAIIEKKSTPIQAETPVVIEKKPTPIQAEKPKKEWSKVQTVKKYGATQVKVENPIKPKKITGTKFEPLLYNGNKYATPYTIWCEIMHVYQEPFEETKFTYAGKIIEPLQFMYIRKRMQINNSAVEIVSPDEYFGGDAKNLMFYDFFHENEIFGGMWDYLMIENGEIKGVFEMKTTQLRFKDDIESDNDENGKLRTYCSQASLYAWLLGVDEFYLVISFLDDNDYNHPEEYLPIGKNTIIKKRSLKEMYGDYDEQCIAKVRKWWMDYVESGISPEPDLTNPLDKAVYDIVQSKYFG